MNLINEQDCVKFSSPLDIVQGYYRDIDNKRLFFFYGTMGWKDILCDALCSSITPKWDENIKLHLGFWIQADIAYDLISEWLDPTKEIIFAGHSLGGAIAMILAYRYSKRAPCRFIGLATPGCVGDLKFRKEYQKRNIESVNYVYGIDVVPRVYLITWVVGLVQTVKPTVIKENIFYRDHVTYYVKNDVGGI
jgi:pimeloyl-ACP methyl ester carboxylesterase